MRSRVLWLSSALLTLSIASVASANGYEIPENGTELMGRAGAWTARADNALAVAYNPAGLAGIGTDLVLNSNFTWQQLCFKRAGTYSTLADPNGTRFDSSYLGDHYPTTCKDNAFKDVNVVPQIAFNYKVNDKLGVAFAIVTPSSAGNANWPDQKTTPEGDVAPGPERYMLLKAQSVIIQPTLGAGFEVAKGIRFGAAFQATMAWLNFSTISEGTMLNKSNAAETPAQDLRADLKLKSLFTPGIILGALVNPTDDLDIGAMFHWSADIHAKSGTVTVTGPYYGDSRSAATTPAISKASLGDFRAPYPWEARLGVRWHPKRAGGTVVAAGARRDLLASDAFDLELDLTYSHNSQFQTLNVIFPNGECIALGNNNCLARIPYDASVPHKWKDVVGIRLGGEYVLVPNRLGVRAGAFFQTSGQNAQYLNLDFNPSQMIGLYLGGTYRLQLVGNAPAGASSLRAGALDLAVGYGHIFTMGLDNSGNGQTYGVTSSPTPSPGACADGTPPASYRSCYPVNSGKTTGSYDMVSLGGTLHF